MYALCLFLTWKGLMQQPMVAQQLKGRTALGLNFEHALLGQTRPSICFWSAAGNAVPSAHKGTQNDALSQWKTCMHVHVYTPSARPQLCKTTADRRKTRNHRTQTVSRCTDCGRKHCTSIACQVKTGITHLGEGIADAYVSSFIHGFHHALSARRM